MGKVLLALLVAAHLGAADEARLLAAEASLADGQPDQALALLRDDPAARAFTRERLCLVRAQWALGNPRSALVVLDEGAAGDCAAWPASVRGQAAQLAAELHVAVGEPDRARTLLAVAKSHGRGDDPVCLGLAAELAAMAGDAAEARRLAEPVWRRQPRTAANASAGLLLARLSAESDPTTARTILAQVRAIEGLSQAQRITAAEQLCRLLLPIQPGQCLVVAERETARAGAAAGTLPLYRALALAALGAGEASAQLAALPPGLRDDPAVAQAMARLDADRVAGRQADIHQRIERAAAAADLGRWDQVETLIAADAGREPAALALLARCPGVDLRPLLGSPAAQDPQAALVLARALVLAVHQAEAWTAVQPALAAAERGGDPAAWIWAAEAARVSAPARVAGLLERAVAADPPPAEAGIAWCRLAESREAAGVVADDAWRHAAELLPADHPWKASACARAARSLLANGGDLAMAERLLLGIPEGVVTGEAMRCRFLLAQIWARQGRPAEARRLAASLLPAADEAQRARVQAFLGGLDPAECQPGDTP